MSSGTASVNGMQIAYETFGAEGGTPVMLIMGLSTQMLAWPDEFCELLAAQGSHVVRFDNRDSGLSTHLTESGPGQPIRSLFGWARPAYRLVDMARDAIGLLEALGWTSAHIVGVSMGGMIAQNVALLRPDVVRSLTSMSSTTGTTFVGKPHPKVLKQMMTVKPAIDRAGGIANSMAMYELIRSVGFPPDHDRVARIAGLSYDRCYDPVGGTRQFSAILAAPDRTAALQRIRVPTTVIHGLADPLVHSSGGLATAAAIKQSRLITIPGMGHDLPAGLWSRFADEIGTTVRAGEQARSTGQVSARSLPGT